jgi:cytoskeletal protein CcmA (bactofilin family)
MPTVHEFQEGHLSYFSSQAKAGRDRTSVNGNGIAAHTEPATAAKSGTNTVSTIGPGMAITGNIVCEASAHIFGRVTGDIQAIEIVIGDGAQVEGNITGHDITINGAFKGAVRGNAVRLKGAATIEGEIYSRSLTVEENVQFEGVSRRLDQPVALSLHQPAVEAPAPVLIEGNAPIAEAAA